MPGEAAYLISPRGVSALRGRPIEILAPLLDGTRTVEAIVRDAAPDLGAHQVGAVLGRLAEAGVLAFRTEPPDPAGTPERAYWDLAGLDGEAAAHAVSAASVELLAVGTADRRAVGDALRGSGLTVAEETRTDGSATDDGTEISTRPRPALGIVVCDDYLAPGVGAIDRAMRAEGRPWLIAKTSGPDPWVGPFFVPGQRTACWHCLAYRLERLRQPELLVRQIMTPGSALPEASIAAARSVAAHLVALEAAKWLAGVREQHQGSVHTLDTLTLQGRSHPLAPRPQCPECGDPKLVAQQAGRPIRPRSRPAAPVVGSRALSLEEVDERYGRLVDPVTGVVGEIRRDPGAPEGFHRCIATMSVLVGGAPDGGVQALMRTHNGGKGATALEARVGALGEVVERHSACRQGDEAVVRAAYRDLGDAAVHPDSCQLFDPRQYADRERWNRLHGSAHWVCEAFDEARVREWTPMWSLTEQRQRLVPTALLYFHHGMAGSSSEVYADSNGNAAGGSIEETIAHGFLELVERDAVAMWWYNRAQRPGVHLDSVADALVNRVRQVCASAGRRVWALDLTTDLGIPVIAALSAEAGPSGPQLRYGFGAHFDAGSALRRAMAELVQAAAPAPTASVRSEEPAATAPDLDAYLLPCAENEAPTTPRPRQDLAAPGSYEEIADIVAVLRSRGLEMLVLDQTRPDVAMPVVKVLVPGLRPMRARFAPGRLFDVPVRLGWLAEPTPYDRLNPIPLPL